MAKFWGADKFRYHLGKKCLDLSADTFKLALVTSALACPETAWAASTVYVAGDVRVPTSRDGHRYLCSTGGTSGGTEPTFSTTDDAETEDGTVIWTEYGGDLCALGLWSEVSGSEAATGDGYTTGGETLASLTYAQTYRDTVWDAADITFSALTKTFRYGFLYKSGTDNSIVNPVIGYILFDDDFADKTISGVDFWIQLAASGITTLTKG